MYVHVPYKEVLYLINQFKEFLKLTDGMRNNPQVMPLRERAYGRIEVLEAICDSESWKLFFNSFKVGD